MSGMDSATRNGVARETFTDGAWGRRRDRSCCGVSSSSSSDANRTTSRSRTVAALKIALCLSLTFAGIPGFETNMFAGLGTLPAAEASQAMIRISQVGLGVNRKIKLGLNKAVVIDLPTDAHDILVADPAITDAVTRSSRRLYVFGKQVGQTNVFIFGPNGEELITVDLEIERDISGLEANLKRFIPESDIKVEIISDNIVLSGTVRTPQDASQAERLAEIFVKGGEATTRNVTASAFGHRRCDGRPLQRRPPAVPDRQHADHRSRRPGDAQGQANRFSDQRSRPFRNPDIYWTIPEGIFAKEPDYNEIDQLLEDVFRKWSSVPG